MCEIYGFSGDRKKELRRDLREFYAHSDKHPNGWGLALFDEEKTELLKEEYRADRSTLLRERLNAPVLAQNALAHIRLATIGNVEPDNCHPFTATDNSGRTWTLIHNGTVFEAEKLHPYIFLQKGETDSERILLYLVDCVNAAIKRLGRPLTAAERFAVLDEIVRDSSPKNKLNILMYDGETLYAHTNFRDSLYYRRDQYGVTFSTQPLAEGIWNHVPFTTLLGYQNGAPVFTGTEHHHEYFFDPSAYKPLYMAYSGL